MLCRYRGIPDIPEIVFHIVADVGHDTRYLPTSEVATRGNAKISDPISEIFTPYHDQSKLRYRVRHRKWQEGACLNFYSDIGVKNYDIGSNIVVVNSDISVKTESFYNMSRYRPGYRT